MSAVFQTADLGSPSRKRERGQGRQLVAKLSGTVLVRMREFIRRYCLIGLNRSRYFALAGRNCFSVFLDFGQFRAIRATNEASEAGRFIREERKSAKGGSLSVDGDGGDAIRIND
jgi:hypothetical protein